MNFRRMNSNELMQFRAVSSSQVYGTGSLRCQPTVATTTRLQVAMNSKPQGTEVQINTMAACTGPVPTSSHPTQCLDTDSAHLPKVRSGLGPECCQKMSKIHKNPNIQFFTLWVHPGGACITRTGQMAELPSPWHLSGRHATEEHQTCDLNLLKPKL